MTRFSETVSLIIAITLSLLSPASADVKRAKFNAVLKLGEAAPTWKDLPGVDGKKHGLEDYKAAKVLVLIFTCNHCPVAKVYEQRFIDFTNKHRDQGVRVIAVNVNRNKADQLEPMRERAESRKFPFPYLYDDSQQIGRQYGATTTPHIFVLDQERKMAFMGAFDDQNDASRVQKRFAEDAVNALIAGEQPAVRESRPRGCAIKYEDQ